MWMADNPGKRAAGLPSKLETDTRKVARAVNQHLAQIVSCAAEICAWFVEQVYALKRKANIVIQLE